MRHVARVLMLLALPLILTHCAPTSFGGTYGQNNSNSKTDDPTVTPTPEPSPAPSPSPDPSPTPVATPTPTPLPEPTATPVPTPVATPTPTPAPTATPATPTPVPTPRQVTESFQQDNTKSLVDIVVVDDDSESMNVEQSKMAGRFKSFVSALSDIDYHIGIVTTDVENNADGSKGRLAKIKGLKNVDFITSDMLNADKLFNATVQRSEIGSGNEQPMEALVLAIDKRNAENKGFFRDGADVAFIVLSNEDENSDGKDKKATKPETVLAHFQKAWGATKRLMSFGVIIQPGDKACFAAERAEVSDHLSAYYGTFVTKLAALTKGQTFSICADDYSAALAQISQDVNHLVNSFDLHATPLPGSVTVTLSTGGTIPFTVDGTRVTFGVAPPRGATITIEYSVAP